MRRSTSKKSAVKKTTKTASTTLSVLMMKTRQMKKKRKHSGDFGDAQLPAQPHRRQLRLWHCAVPEGTNGGWRQKTMRRAAVAEYV